MNSVKTNLFNRSSTIILGLTTIFSLLSILLVYLGLEFILGDNPFCTLERTGRGFNTIEISWETLASVVLFYMAVHVIALFNIWNSFLILGSKSKIYPHDRPQRPKQCLRISEYIFFVLVLLSTIITSLDMIELLELCVIDNPPAFFESGLRFSWLFYFIVLGCISSLHAYICCTSLYKQILNYYKCKGEKLDHDKTNKIST